MKIGILQFSDYHISNKRALNPRMFRKMFDSIGPDISDLIIIFSGDIAYSALVEEYEIAEKIIGNILSMASEKLNINLSNIHVSMVPGNHDVEGYDFHTLEELNNYVEDNILEERALEDEIRLENFNNFAEKYNCSFSGSNYFLIEKTLKISDKTIKINLINSAPLSTNVEDRGYHIISFTDIDRIENNIDHDFIISVLHHPSEWFHEDVKNTLEDVLSLSSNITLSGHQHHQKSETRETSNGATIFIDSGEFSNKGYWKTSEFVYLTVDLAKKSMVIKKFKYDGTAKYDLEKETPYMYSSKSSIKAIKPNEHFYLDNKLHQPCDFRKLFVFPNLFFDRFSDDSKQLHINEVKNITNIEQFETSIENHKRVLITGSSNSGKTYLLKKLFDNKYQNQYCIYASAEEFPNDNNIKRRINFMIDEVYKGETVDSIRCKGNTITIYLDNINLIKSDKLFRIIDGINTYVDIVVASYTDSIEIDLGYSEIFENTFSKYSKFSISEFYGEARKNLIASTITAYHEKLQTDSNLIVNINNSIKRNNSSFITQPDFIVMYTKDYISNFNGQSRFAQEAGTIFSKVFESNITLMLNETADSHNVDLYLNLLGVVAYKIHELRSTQGIGPESLSELLIEYDSQHGINFSVKEFKKSVTECGILIEDSSGFYHFRNADFHSYFVAYDLDRRYSTDISVHDDLNYLLDYSCFKVNADILIFFIYLNQNTNMLNIILEKTTVLLSDWEQFKLEDSKFKYLSMGSGTLEKITAPNSDDKSNSEQIENEIEKNEVLRRNEKEVLSLYDYNEESADDYFNQIYRSISLLNVISKSLPVFFNFTKKEEKEVVVEHLFSIPNKIFFKWASFNEEHFEDIIEEFKQFMLHNIPKHKNQTMNDDTAIRKKFVEISMQLYLGLLNLAADSSIDSRTIGLMKGDEKLITKQLQYLVMLSKTDKYETYYNLAAILYDNNDNVHLKNLIVRLTYYYILKATNIDRTILAKITSKFFDKDRTTQILLSVNREKS